MEPTTEIFRQDDLVITAGAGSIVRAVEVDIVPGDSDQSSQTNPISVLHYLNVTSGANRVATEALGAFRPNFSDSNGAVDLTDGLMMNGLNGVGTIPGAALPGDDLPSDSPGADQVDNAFLELELSDEDSPAARSVGDAIASVAERYDTNA